MESEKQRILAALGARKGAGPVTLSLALGPGKEAPEKIVRRLTTEVNRAVDIVDVHRLARIVSVRGAPKDLIALVKSAEIEGALLSDQGDILPHPVRERVVDIESGEDFVPIPERRPSAAQRRTGTARAPARRKR